MPYLLLAALLSPFLARAPAPVQDGPAPDPAARPPVRPAVRPERVLRYYNLKGRLDAGDLQQAARAAGLEIVRGPLEEASRPSISVVVVSAPAAAGAREVERALKLSGIKLEPLEVFLFRGRVENGFPAFGGLATKLDYLLGMSGDIRWCELEGEWTQFYCVRGKLDAEELEELWGKLQRPLGDEPATLGPVVQETFAWTLAREPDGGEARKLTKALGKLDGVRDVVLEGAALTVTVELAGLAEGGPATAFDGSPAARGTPLRATFSTLAVWELLEGEELLAAD